MEQEEEAFGILEIINYAKDFLAELKKRWLLITCVILITSTLGLLYALNVKPKYVATSTVMLENSKSGGSMSGALALASQFGLMNGGNSSVINEDKLLEIITAETIIKAALFKKATIDSTTDILANHFINLFGYSKAWEKDELMKGFKFTNQKEKLSLLENHILNIFYAQIKATFLTTEKSKSGIITINIKTKSEMFSKYFNQSLVESLTSFYVNRITEKGKMNVNIIQKRVDSVAIALKDAEYALARWKDGNFQLVKAQGLMAEMELRRNVEVCNSIYIEGIKQLEVSKFTLLQDTPFLQIIDKPILPLEPKGKISILNGLLLGAIVGFILSCLYVFSRKKYTELLTQQAQLKE